MPSRRWLGLAACAAAACGSVAPPAPRPPNLVVLLVDDLGWRDLACCGQDKVATPSIDRLAAEGMRLSHAAAASPVGPASRAALLTGRHPARLGLAEHGPDVRTLDGPFLPPLERDAMPLAEVTLAELLRARGYATWHVGAWQLGDAGFGPADQGFEVLWTGGGDRPASHFVPRAAAAGTAGAGTDGGGAADGEFLADVAARTAAERIRAAAGEQRPFFLHLAFHAMQPPIEARPADVERHAAARAQRIAAAPAWQRTALHEKRPLPVFAAMLEHLDAAVGTVLRAIDEAGIAGETLVVLTSDNGGATAHSDNAPLRGGRRSLWEGGLRVPLLVRWPGHVPAGVVCDVPTVTQDVHRALRAAAGVPIDAEVAADAFDLLPVWLGAPVRERDPICWHFPQAESATVGPRGAIRDGRWKLIEDLGTGAVVLFDLASDPGETTDLAAREPDRARALQQVLAAWRRRVGAAMPTPNPAWAGPADGTR
ncbi:MAG: sulfatase-like hydrolase/transferase [Planctomycetes bacterium]|nr:sulfatase-like hydrolase/transferase [Planctomycetota bacterium]